MAETAVDHSTKRVAIVTGGNKGIGLEICRQLASNGGIVVVLTARDEKRGVEAVENLRNRGVSDVIFHQLNVSDPASVVSLKSFVKSRFGKLDILVNNAGISGSITDADVRTSLNIVLDDVIGERAKELKEVIKQNFEVAEACLRTNYYGVKLVTEGLLPLLQLSDSARIVNVSSSLGLLKFVTNEKANKELEDVENLTEEKVDEVVEGFLEDEKNGLVETKGWALIFSAYILSKAALNAYTRILAKKYPKISINAVNPGYVKTDMNYNSGILTVEEGAKGPVMLALMPECQYSGMFFDQTEVSTF